MFSYIKCYVLCTLAVMAKVASPVGFICICNFSVHFSFWCRYALICQQCFSHNGMALKEEFEYIGKNYLAVRFKCFKYFILCQFPCNAILFQVLLFICCSGILQNTEQSRKDNSGFFLHTVYSCSFFLPCGTACEILVP